VSQSGSAFWQARGQSVLFLGYARYWKDLDKDNLLPELASGQSLNLQTVETQAKQTQPPPRYTEASLVKKLEELGIGRPSTYASIIQVLQDRNYVRLEGRAFVPEDRGRIVTAFLVSFFRRYVEYNFTAELEGDLDNIAEGKAEWKKVLKSFWTDFSGAVGETKDLTITKVIDVLDEDLSAHFFPSTAPGKDPRSCPSCETGRIGLRLGKFGAFIGCSNYPECKYTRKLAIAGDGSGELLEGDKELGKAENGEAIYIRRGPYGLYVQQGEDPTEKGKKAVKPKRVSLLRGMNPNEIDLTLAQKLLTLPREVGIDPETNEMIVAGVGRFGPYLKLGSIFKSIPKDDDVLEIGLNRAVVLLAEAKAKGPKELRKLGAPPKSKLEITINRGRFGPYLKHGKVMANLPKGTDIETVTMEQAIALLDAKANKGKKPKAEATEAEVKSKKAVTKKVTAKKPVAKKASKKKSA
jgi:DNA topoisomerase-1